MDSVAVFFTGLLAACVVWPAKVSSSQDFVHTTQEKWLQAQQACKDTGPHCDLWTPGPEGLGGSGGDSTQLQPKTRYWVGAKTVGLLEWQSSGRPLIQAQGCYEAGTTTLKSTVRPLRYNGPERCLTQCDGSRVALQNRTCFCLDAETMTSLRARPLEECHVFCSREPSRCGGDLGRLSVYSLPDRTLYEKRGKKTKFFWRRTSTNENEYILLTNQPGDIVATACVTTSGKYIRAAKGSPCPSGSQPVTFDQVDVMTFLEATASLRDWEGVSFSLPLEYRKQSLWLHGGQVQGATGQGQCTAMQSDGQRRSLINVSCKTRLPALCSCYTRSSATEVTTTEPLTSEQYSTEASSDSTSATSSPPETTAGAEYSSWSTSQGTMTSGSQTTSASRDETDKFTTSVYVTLQPTSSVSTPSGDDVTYTDNRPTTSADSPVYTPDNTAVGHSTDSATANGYVANTTTGQMTGESKGENSTLLFPVHHGQDKSGSPSSEQPAAAPGKSSDSDAASAAISIEMIIGVALAATTMVVVVVIIVVFVLQRRKKKSSSSLLKERSSKSSKRGTNYPI